MHGVRVKKFPQYKAKLAAMASLDEDSPITSLPTNKFIRFWARRGAQLVLSALREYQSEGGAAVNGEGGEGGEGQGDSEGGGTEVGEGEGEGGGAGGGGEDGDSGEGTSPGAKLPLRLGGLVSSLLCNKGRLERGEWKTWQYSGGGCKCGGSCHAARAYLRWPDGLPLVCYASGHVHGTVAIHTAVVEWACNHDPAFKADYERAVAEREEAAKQRKEGGMQAAGARDMRQATARGVTAASDEDNNIELGTEAPQRGNKQPKPGSKSRRQLTDAEAAEVVATYKEKRAAGLKNKEVWPAINAALGKDWSRNKMEAAAKAARIWTQDRRGPKSKRNDDLEEEDAQDSEGGEWTQQTGDTSGGFEQEEGGEEEAGSAGRVEARPSSSGGGAGGGAGGRGAGEPERGPGEPAAVEGAAGRPAGKSRGGRRGGGGASGGGDAGEPAAVEGAAGRPAGKSRGGRRGGGGASGGGDAGEPAAVEGAAGQPAGKSRGGRRGGGGASGGGDAGEPAAVEGAAGQPAGKGRRGRGGASSGGDVGERGAAAPHTSPRRPRANRAANYSSVIAAELGRYE
ncbi:hypothetical protein CHLRE_12g489001v5 [Chlamydomonas reinhardtii]|uniref:Uncharacterized protein n=1 Tax=Chlamydomonas reinhardtii TaxID=3055 RepID=A0A2K3D284_CHLRE|nr:uncharacterized protein CHLRE_12g489001v5 [Chlamydomonas reinhardtii]PNW74643.1 hypothetical protein CHLRE_12g489001v5 [Chlamydomonas reinhardtii]